MGALVGQLLKKGFIIWMKEVSRDNEVEASWGRSIDDMKDAGFIGVDMGAWVIGDADIHLVWDGAVENLGLTTSVKDDHGSAEKRKNQEYTTPSIKEE